MAESRLRTLSIDFAVQILNLVKFLKSQHETIVSNQIGRVGTSSIGVILCKQLSIITLQLNYSVLSVFLGAKTICLLWMPDVRGNLCRLKKMQMI